ncbi:MAG: acyltransferase [Gemmatimonadota bacterium]|nr:acyltransferase [Gemmatimonadota bacterium]MDE2871334.1 acyltransferase [Gemmatimonadota bacterium]
MGRIIRYLASMLPFSMGTRAYLYRLSGMRIGSRVSIDRNVQVTRPDMVVIGSRVTIANAVSILGDVTAVHSRLEEAYDLRKTARVVIEDDVYIGVKATILPGVRIGRMATIGANTLVIADVPAYGVVLGVPGRVMMIRAHD